MPASQVNDLGLEGRVQMSYMAILIALGLVLLFGYGSRIQRLKSQRKQEAKTPKVSPLSKVKRQSNLRRIK